MIMNTQIGSKEGGPKKASHHMIKKSVGEETKKERRPSANFFEKGHKRSSTNK